jgi:hypothetical protein
MKCLAAIGLFALAAAACSGETGDVRRAPGAGGDNGGSSGAAGSGGSAGSSGNVAGGSGGGAGVAGASAGSGAGGVSGSSGSGGSVGSGGSAGVAGVAGSGAAGGRAGAGGGAGKGGGSGSGGGSGAGGSGGSGGVSGAGGSAGTTAVDGGTCKFSFFVTSLVAIRRESGNQNGYGGNLGGLAGADAICKKIATTSMACAANKTWRAFLSASTEDAIDRVGTGPWYDRKGRLVANNVADLANTRPRNADPAIANDLPNEDGVPNHNPETTGNVDNHDTLTGSNASGRLYSATATCSDWTSAGAGKPRVGHSWPGGPSQHWINAMDANGCQPGVNLSTVMSTCTGVGCEGGYGGFYCFALTP